jgi:hypothetical protein
MQGIDVEIGGTAMYSAKTDAQGANAVQVQDGLYQVHADLTGTYQGATWVLPLYPSDGSSDEVSASSGIVKNFVWRLTGPIPGMDPSNARDYYGATVKLLVQDPLVLPFDFTQSSLPPDSVLDITLTPQGKLVDGSSGNPLTYTRTLQAANNQGTQDGFDGSQVLGDMPLGTYTITGTITTPDGATEALVFAAGDQAYTQASTVTFQPAATSAGREGILPQVIRVSTSSGQ